MLERTARAGGGSIPIPTCIRASPLVGQIRGTAKGTRATVRGVPRRPQDHDPVTDPFVLIARITVRPGCGEPASRSAVRRRLGQERLGRRRRVSQGLAELESAPTSLRRGGATLA